MIRKVIGIALLILIVKFLVPRLFLGFENALLAFFEFFHVLFARSAEGMKAGAGAPFMSIPVVGIE